MSRSRNRYQNRTRDVTTSIATQRVRYIPLNLPLSLLLRPLARFNAPSTVLRAYEDRRTWHPVAPRPARSFSGPTRLQITPTNRHSAYPSPSIQFQAPERVLVCVRRHRRREVLFARNKAGRSGQRPPRRTWWSAVHC